MLAADEEEDDNLVCEEDGWGSCDPVGRAVPAVEISRVASFVDEGGSEDSSDVATKGLDDADIVGSGLEEVGEEEVDVEKEEVGSTPSFTP